MNMNAMNIINQNKNNIIISIWILENPGIYELDNKVYKQLQVDFNKEIYYL